MMRLGFPIPKTWLIPPKEYAKTADLEPTLTRYAKLFDLGAIGDEIGYPLFMKPYDGGAWVGVSKIESEGQLRTAYEQSGVGPEDLDLVELHDCFATAELVHYDNLKLCDEGGAVDFFRSGAPWRDGGTPVNVSGGLQSKGHPISATGIANIWEVCHHLRGEAGDRQIEGAKVGLAHVIGLGSACGVHVLEKSAA